MKLHKVLKSVKKSKKTPIGKEVLISAPSKAKSKRKVEIESLKKEMKERIYLKKKAEALIGLSDSELKKVLELIKKFKGK